MVGARNKIRKSRIVYNGHFEHFEGSVTCIEYFKLVFKNTLDFLADSIQNNIQHLGCILWDQVVGEHNPPLITGFPTYGEHSRCVL